MADPKYIFVGPKACGKTSLILALLGQYEPEKRIVPTQGLTGYGPYIDLPGDYCDNRCYSILSVCSQQAQFIVLTIGADQRSMPLPDGFTQLFIRPVIGVITKIDLNADHGEAELWHRRMGVKGPVFCVSAHTGEGIATLRDFLKNESTKKEKK
ncbi:MAG TPA: EutP/PduV family microcompartment system protein [Syntrophomonas sp.]|nr:EutP/PduV family microcompartment system protein [Syntrophomonas sp.]